MKEICYIFALVVVTHASTQPILPALETRFVHPNNAQITPIGRIIGGQVATPHAYPYQVGIYVAYSLVTSFCGGSLVSNNYVLTAAHCAEGAVSMNLVFGAQQIDKNEIGQVRQTSTEFIIHSGWDSNLLVNDIALIKLKTPVIETNYIKIIKIASGSSDYSGQIGTVAGWGKTTNEQTAITSVLRYVNSKILTNDNCKKVDSDYKAIVKPSLMCLSGDGTVGTCSGDSGGPLVVGGIQVGLVSFGVTNCLSGKPSVFTRLTEFKDWIQKNSDVKI